MSEKLIEALPPAEMIALAERLEIRAEQLREQAFKMLTEERNEE